MARLTPDIAFGLHAHQPAGNFNHVFEEITEQSYKPFLKTYNERRPPGKISYHASGILLEWWKNNMPGIIDLLGELVNDDKIEILGGGFYEPILPLIPPVDRKNQVVKLLDYTEKLFGTRPQGIWLTERIWSPELPGDLAEIGIKYTIVDDFHFQVAGWDRSKLSGYYMTEHNGSKLGIFPINQQLRYRIPFHDVDRLTEYLKDIEPEKVLTMADDAEKFGSWPETYKWVYEDGWLKRFFEACEKDEINLCSLGDVFRSKQASGRCYLPTASYEEMLEWALPARRLTEYEEWKEKQPGDAEKFGCGGYFHNFLVKYEESNRLHKKMQWLSRRFQNEEDGYENLLAGQCNDTYWHGVFGGLCLPHLRSEAWRNLTAASAALNPDGDFLKLDDYDCDGQSEVIYNDNHQFAIIDPAAGAEMITWELFAAERNILDTLSRRWEPYLEEEKRETGGPRGDVETIHHRKTKVPGEWLEQWSADQVVRAGFQPVFFEGEPTCEKLVKNEGINYLLRDKNPINISSGKNNISFDYNDFIKQISYEFGEYLLNWKAVCSAAKKRWGMVFNIGFRTPEKEFCRLEFGKKSYAVNKNNSGRLSELELIDELAGYKINIKSGSELDFFCYPVETISRSEEGAEKIYQGTALVFTTTNNKISLTWNWAGGQNNA
ncbi:MAG: alpha-amylase/4-alpha-glucanotransferase domain-containing protein [bacterium]